MDRLLVSQQMYQVLSRDLTSIQQWQNRESTIVGRRIKYDGCEHSCSKDLIYCNWEESPPLRHFKGKTRDKLEATEMLVSPEQVVG